MCAASNYRIQKNYLVKDKLTSETNSTDIAHFVVYPKQKIIDLCEYAQKLVILLETGKILILEPNQIQGQAKFPEQNEKLQDSIDSNAHPSAITHIKGHQLFAVGYYNPQKKKGSISIRIYNMKSKFISETILPELAKPIRNLSTFKRSHFRFLKVFSSGQQSFSLMLLWKRTFIQIKTCNYDSLYLCSF